MSCSECPPYKPVLRLMIIFVTRSQMLHDWPTIVALLLPTEVTAVLFLASSPISVNTIMYELLHLAWWNFARTCILTTSRNLFNFKVIARKSRSHGFCAFLSAWYPQAVLSLERGFYLLLCDAVEYVQYWIMAFGSYCAPQWRSWLVG